MLLIGYIRDIFQFPTHYDLSPVIVFTIFMLIVQFRITIFITSTFSYDFKSHSNCNGLDTFNTYLILENEYQNQAYNHQPSKHIYILNTAAVKRITKIWSEPF
jgi:hypothetical protein